VGAVGAALCLVDSVILFYGSWVYVAKMYEIGIEMQDLPIPQWIPRAILIVSFALLILRFGQVLWRILSGKEVRLHLGDEAAEALRAQEELTRDPEGAK
jgi:C4-dicarboxylate transporter DctQ subunit